MAPDRTLTDHVPRVLVKEKIADAGVELLRADFDVELGIDWDDAELERRIGEAQRLGQPQAVDQAAELAADVRGYVEETIVRHDGVEGKALDDGERRLHRR